VKSGRVSVRQIPVGLLHSAELQFTSRTAQESADVDHFGLLFETTEMWIFCCGMKRSGSTLQYQLTARIVEEAGIGQRVDWVPEDRFAELRKEYEHDRSYKVFKCHLATEEILRLFVENQAKGIYCYRDLRDVCASWMTKTSSNFEQLWRSDLIRECMAQFEIWTSQKSMLVTRYEQMIGNLEGEVRRIAMHLGVEMDEAQCRTIAADYQMDKQRARVGQVSAADSQTVVQHGNQVFDSRELLHSNHIHRGDAGYWREYFSDIEIFMIEHRARQWLVDCEYVLASPRLKFVDRLRAWRRARRMDKPVPAVS
jgi:hypothetical protein